VLELEDNRSTTEKYPVIVMSDRIDNLYGLAVDHILGERELVVQELDKRLGKVADISSGAFMENGDPVLIVDVEDLVRSIDTILQGGRLRWIGAAAEAARRTQMKRVLVVDDSITVREVESRLLKNAGYSVDTAVDGMDGWNAAKMGKYDLIVTDIDMPRMNGIELVRKIKADNGLKETPIIVVSYKDREKERVEGLEAGADYYLTKSSFHDETLLKAVSELIGKARE
jgi:two-component system sensor histidine kinase and response regulator WspE